MAKGFRIAARALRQLGAELITSDDVALNELIKNAFDARSPRVAVHINAMVDVQVLAVIEQRLRAGEITSGNAREMFVRVFATELGPDDRSAVLSKFDRATSLGKQKLLEYIESLRVAQSISVIDTGKGMSRTDLSDRFLVIGTPGKLKEREDGDDDGKPLLGDKGIGRLSMMRLGNQATVRSTQLGSVRWNEIHFIWSKFNDPSLFLDDIDVDVERAGASSENESGTRIEIKELTANWNTEKVQSFIHRYMRRLQDPFAKKRHPYPVDIYLNAKRLSITALPKWMTQTAQFRADIQFNPDGIDGSDQVFRRSIKWRTSSTSEVRSWSMKELVSQLEVAPAIFKGLGPFTATCLWFNRSMLAVNEVDRTRAEIAEELNQWCGGFAVYRDNFRVGKTGGMEDDWLEWDSGALKNKGYALNRYQTIGSVSISSRTNPRLVDSANRERLIACPEQELLKKLLGEVLVGDLRMHINTVREAEAKIGIAEESTTASLKASEDALKRTLAEVDRIGKLLPKEQRQGLTDIRATLQGQVEYVKTIKNSLNMARETRVELLELANIGLVVEIVIHELTRLTERTGELLADLQRDGNSNVVDVVDNLRAQIVATNKRIRTVDAMSPSGRQRKEQYDAVSQTRGIVSGFKNRFARHDIYHFVTVDDEPAENWSVEVYMVKGLIAQALENLLANSVYWLQQGLKPGSNKREIRINLDSKALTLYISDNGPGIDPHYAKEIFRPYYSTRKKGKGLGLYIASELVEYHGGRLYLDSLPEDDGRLRTFVLELPKDGA
ncbi:signal transduction histidine kinase [Xanthomonas sp. F14]